MASIAMMIKGAILNTASFTGSNYLAKYLSGDNGKAALVHKVFHEKALEAYETGQAKYVCNRTKLFDWIETNREIKAQGKQNFMNADYAFKCYNQAHPDQQIKPCKEPQFTDYYQPREQEKQGKLLLVGSSELALG